MGREAGKFARNSSCDNEIRCFISSLIFFFNDSLNRVAITMIMLKVVLKVVKDIFSFSFL